MKKNRLRNKHIFEYRRAKAQEHKPYVRISLCTYAVCSLALLLFSGCNSGQRTAELKTKIENLSEENTKLTIQVEQAKIENEELKKRVTVLQDLPDDVKGINLYQLENVNIQNYSGLFDENNDGKIDTLIVRIQPIDNDGDIIKASGSVIVELWDLNKPENQARIGNWPVGVEELKKDWNSFLITNYNLRFDVSGKIDKFDEPLTIKMNFTDYLSGKVFQAQKVIEP
jgi:outer membrane murein-binding lipoprotein Lpp